MRLAGAALAAAWITYDGLVTVAGVANGLQEANPAQAWALAHGVFWTVRFAWVGVVLAAGLTPLALPVALPFVLVMAAVSAHNVTLWPCA